MEAVSHTEKSTEDKVDSAIQKEKVGTGGLLVSLQIQPASVTELTIVICRCIFKAEQCTIAFLANGILASYNVQKFL